jgi:polysaccharide export outer membrane protein
MAVNNTAPYQPAPVYRAPLAPVQPATSDYGFKPDIRGSEMPAPAPTPASAPAPAPVRSTDNTPYGYNKGDGEPKADVITPMPGGATPYYQPPFQAADNSPRADPDYVLGTGDKIHLSVFDEADLSGDYTVDGSGYVRLPLIGQVRAAGYTPPQLEAAVGSALANGYLRSPRVSVEVVTYRPFYVIGAVGRPGEFPYVNHMTVLNAIAMAGGFLPSAVESEVYIRPQGSTQEYAVRADTASQVHPGDVVRVKTTLFWDTMSLFSPLNGVAAVAAAGVR